VQQFSHGNLVLDSDSREQAFPEIWSVERQLLGRPNLLVRRRLFGVALREQDGALAEREESCSQVGGGNAESVGMIAECPVVEPGKLTDTPVDACANGRGP